MASQLKQEAREEKLNRRAAYETMRNEFSAEVFRRLRVVTDTVNEFHTWLTAESRAFQNIMQEYGQIRNGTQGNHTIVSGDYKLEIRRNKVKRFDERADLAAERLIDYLKAYIAGREKGADDPMYQLAMSLLERNKEGDLDYKSISKLYELEDRFDEEYHEIMELFRESNIVQGTAMNYYFHRRNPETGVWERIEPSFCRL